MRDVRVNNIVRTNGKYRAFFKTDEVICGRVTGFFYDHKTVIVKNENGREDLVHVDWLEIDEKMKDNR